MTFEYYRIKRYATKKCDFIYFFNSFIILDLIYTGRKNSGICGFSIGPPLLMASYVKAISIDVITGK
jgi:hypothetical protein